jgi:hypothetical protein
MFISLICLLHLQAMFNYEMDLSSYFTCLHVLELLLFIAAIIKYDICLSYMLVLFGIRIFNLFKYVESMSLSSLILQHVTRESLHFLYKSIMYREHPTRVCVALTVVAEGLIKRLGQILRIRDGRHSDRWGRSGRETS